MGHIFKLGTRYSEALEAYFPDQQDEQRPIIMGCYGIGVGRLLAAAIEQHNDDRGIVFPASIAPYQVCLTALNVENADVAAAAESLYEELRRAGVETLYDDRSESAGVKFNDADLLGLPLRLVVSARNLRQGVVEVKRRNESDAATVPAAEVVDTVKQMAAS